MESLRTGDIFIVDSERFGARIVKFFMIAPTIYQYIWRAITGKQETVEYYHPGILRREADNTIYGIEQQSKVQIADINKILSKKKYIIIRKKDLTLKQRQAIFQQAEYDLGEKFDVLQCFGMFLTWLTGIKLFQRIIHMKNAELCVGRVAKWFKNAINEDFGEKHYRDVTTHIMVKYIKAHPEDWEIIREVG
jgi:hypothetical protein